MVFVFVLAEHLAIGRPPAIPSLGLKQLGEKMLGSNLGYASAGH